jgi:hypothetical protein
LTNGKTGDGKGALLLNLLRRVMRRLFPWKAEFAHEKIARLRDSARLDRLEFILTEHPAIAARGTRAPLPSPAVSIIMPTWNRGGIVGAAIRSVQAQTFTDWELIVLDDGSADHTSDAVASFLPDPRIRYVRLPHAGQCVARNHGLGIANGALIAYLDSDNLWYPRFLAVAVAVFEHGPDIDCAYGALVTDTHGARIMLEPFDRDRLLAGNFIDMSTFVHRRQLVARFGGFDARTSPLEDWDLVLRYTNHAPACRLPVLAVRYREMDDIRVSDTQARHLPTETIRGKWS